jgi:hypothetical protein
MNHDDLVKILESIVRVYPLNKTSTDYNCFAFAAGEGDWENIEHELEGLENPNYYGVVQQILKRSAEWSSPTSTTANYLSARTCEQDWE